MATNEYTINFVNPNKGTFTIIPNVVDGPNGTSRTTDLDLLGMGNSLWGERILENFLHILENFSSPEDITNPGFPDPATSDFVSTNPTRGQLWYNESRGQIFVYDDTGSPVSWNRVGGITTSATQPSTGSPITSTEGDLWWDTTTYTTDQAEYGRNLHILISDVWTRIVADYLPRNGTKIMTGILNMGSFKIEALADPDSGDDALNLTYADGRYVNVTGDTMTGILNMGANRIENVSDPDSGDDVLNLAFADARYVDIAGDTMTGALNMGTNLINDVVDPAQPQDAATRAYVDNKFAAVAGTPIGTITASAVDYNSGSPTPPIPSGWLLCDGTAVSRTTYSTLFSLISTNYGVGDGSTTFNLPDYRGQFLRGQNLGSGNDPDASARTDRGDGTIGDEIGTKQSFALEDHEHEMGSTNVSATNGGNTGSRSYNASLVDWGRTWTSPRILNAYAANISNNETRPTNINVSYLIYAAV